MGSNVQLIDPLFATIPTHGEGVDEKPVLENGVPKYEDMHIYADLVVERRGRTVLETNNKGLKANLVRTGLDDDVKINFLGFNQNDDSPDNGSFTTRYYDGSVSEKGIQHDSFGITKIRTLINSSYIPQIDIEFTDVRGLAFFNRENSPYRILFDFPPPIFYLTIKGYYGKALQYQMHLVKYTTDFDSSTGNYKINAKFIAVTYAPLTDVLFKYVLNFGLLRNGPVDVELSNTPPKTTFELIQKLKILYENIKSEINNSEDSETYQRSIERQRKIDEAILLLNNYKTTLGKINNNFVPVLFTFETEEGEDFGDIKVINSLGSYDAIIQGEKTSGIPTNMSTRLYVGYIQLIYLNNTLRETLDNVNKEIALEQYKIELKNKTNKLLGETNIEDTDILDPTTIESKEYYGFVSTLFPQEQRQSIAKIVNDDTVLKATYIGIDITQYYLKLYKRKLEINEEKNIAANIVNSQINELILNKLGMLPTIYNIFNIILNDVDHFFDTMRKTAIAAEVHHNETYKQEILSGAGNTLQDFKTNLYAFPLILKQERVCGGEKRVRTAPTNLSDKLPEPFPEMVLLDEFINSFLIYNDIVTLLNMKSEKDSSGNVIWLPCNPADTTLVNSTQSSPYISIDNPLSNVVNTSEDDLVDQVLEIFLRRFYIISQNTFRDSFYGEKINAKNQSPFRELYDDSEAINISNSIISKDLGQLIIKRFNSFENPETFYSYLRNSNSLRYLYDFSGELNGGTNVFSISNGEQMYVNRKNINYSGLELLRNTNRIRVRSQVNDNSDPINKFMSENYENFWTRRNVKSGYKFTDNNLLFFPDSGENKYETKYIVENYPNTKAPCTNPNNDTSSNRGYTYWFCYDNNNKGLKFQFPRDFEISPSYGYTSGSEDIVPYFETVVDDALESGHRGIQGYTGIGSFELQKNLEKTYSIIRPWSVSLAKFGNKVLYVNNFGNGDENNIQNRFIRSIMYLSSFGWALSPFSQFPYYINNNIYNLPAVNEIPFFIAAYIGALIDISDENVNNLKDFCSSSDNYITINVPNTNRTIQESNIIDSGGLLIFADIRDINKFLSDKDKRVFKNAYEDFMQNDFNVIEDETRRIYQEVLTDDSLDSDANRENRELKLEARRRAVEFEEKFKKSDNIIRILMKKNALVNYNQITFDTRENRTLYDGTVLINEDADTYESIASTNENPVKKRVNDSFFEKFFQNVTRELERRVDELEEREDEFTRNVDDNDIRTQTYYSFKNINDKWLSGLNKNATGYPFITEGNENLIDQFAFVDRAMNPIGDTIINTEILLDIEKNPNISVFTVLSQLLSVNGFEFFPLQNFMKFEEQQWRKSFEIDNGPIEQQFPTFVCMYIGGTSNYPTGIGNGFEDDGIICLDNLNVPDFTNSGCDPIPELDNQVNRNTRFRYSDVKAFKVRFGEQNQSMFSDIQIDSKEYPETNESLQILGQIAGDGGPETPIPKGQNLYNLYENRSYKATIKGLGNAMIQPTQYFQLENVPLFNGAYVILEVEHNITPNKMTTSFSGTKLLKYPVPRVLDPAVVFGFEGGSSDVTQPTYETILEGVGTESNPEKAKYNEFYYLKI